MIEGEGFPTAPISTAADDRHACIVSARQRILCNRERCAPNVFLLKLKPMAECVSDGLKD
jgi:hypothetical protein